MPKIRKLKGLEILDSRGRPTVQATCILESGASASASVPSGASTGKAEALELRDGDPERFEGKGCKKAASHVSNEIQAALSGSDFSDQAELDRSLKDLDGTVDKSRLGANAILAVSIAFARAVAVEKGMPLYRYFAKMLEEPIRQFPRMTINLFSGGLHAGKQVPIQDVLIVPASAGSFDEGLVMAHKVYMAAVDLLARKYKMRWLTADEGGLSPPAGRAEELLDCAVESIESAGYKPGEDVCLAVDVASSHFYDREIGRYHIDGKSLSSSQMIEQLEKWVERYPIVSLEDGLAEEDWEHWPQLCSAVGENVLVLGDDLLCTNPERIRKAIEKRACNGLLLKVNQIGTLTEALEAYQLARSAGWQVTISVRSGETEDNWYSDLAVGWTGDQTKAGSITQSERLAKYNRFLAIEDELKLPVTSWPLG